jgi:hypothetical protein
MVSIQRILLYGSWTLIFEHIEKAAGFKPGGLSLARLVRGLRYDANPGTSGLEPPSTRRTLTEDLPPNLASVKVWEGKAENQFR